MNALILAGKEFHPRDLVYMIGPAMGVALGYGLRYALVRMGVGNLVTTLAVCAVFFGVTAAWSVFVFTTLWPVDGEQP